MIASASNVINLCERAIAKGDKDTAHKFAAGVAILTGQPAWRRAYAAIIDGEKPDRFIFTKRLEIPAYFVSTLNRLHDERGEEFKNQSARNGTQVDLTADPDFTSWIETIAPGRIIGAWTTRLRKGGYHTNHIHPRGHDSHVVYVSVPDVTSGHLQFGVTRFGEHQATKTIVPQTGLMLSFPCWLWHGVSEYRGDKPRLTLAFDTVGA